MRVTSETASQLEQSLLTGRLVCPACRSVLRPWGSARSRVVRLAGTADVSVRPRRARCSGCGMTHVLLPDWMLPRRAYAAPIIWEALVAHARGLGYRKIAVRRGLPETTVRDWLRSLRAAAPELNRAAVITLEQRATTTSAWRLAVHLTHGRLIANTNPPHLAELLCSDALPRLRTVRHASEPLGDERGKAST